MRPTSVRTRCPWKLTRFAHPAESWALTQPGAAGHLGLGTPNRGLCHVAATHTILGRATVSGANHTVSKPHDPQKVRNHFISFLFVYAYRQGDCNVHSYAYDAE